MRNHMRGKASSSRKWFRRQQNMLASFLLSIAKRKVMNCVTDDRHQFGHRCQQIERGCDLSTFGVFIIIKFYISRQHFYACTSLAHIMCC